MCIAILNTKNTLPTKTIKNSWENNNQGAGLLYVHNNKLKTFKTYNYKDFLNKYLELRKNKSITKIVLHFRIATSGHEPYTNLHPFLVSENLGFVHNGIISGLGNNQHSDTYQFNEMLKKLPNNFLQCSTTKQFISSYINGSKLVFLDSQNRHTIINETFGHWDKEGNWYSNNSYVDTLDYVYFGNQKVKKNNVTTNSFDVYEEENIEYLSFLFTNVNKYRLETFSELINTPLSDPCILDYAEELVDFYETQDLQKINQILINGEDEEMEKYSDSFLQY